MKYPVCPTIFGIIMGLLSGGPLLSSAAVLDQDKLLQQETFWDNRDWDWYKTTIPFFECPDADITTTYYYRWELLTKHLTYGSPASGYSFTEFIDRPFWSGAYGAISCPAGHQLYEARWLKDPNIARDYARYWLRTPGAQPRRYSTWLADSVWAIHQAQWSPAFAGDLLPDLIKNYLAWEKRHLVPETGLFWQIGHDDGMEFNIASRQTRDIFRGAPGYRPSFNAYMWADAMAIARLATLVEDSKTAADFQTKASSIKSKIQSMLWDPQREFFFQMFRDNEICQEKDFPNQSIKAGTLTYEDGPFAGSPEGRELMGYVPWQFNLPDPGFEKAWQFLMDPDYFYAPYGPSFVGRNDPQFKISKSCCWWSGQSWPYATTQTLKALANLLQNYDQKIITREDYHHLLRIYALTHRKDGKPYLAEAAHPDTGSWEGHDGYNHSEHYLHSGYCDLVITGLIGVKPRADSTFELDPLAPADWPWFALDNLSYHGHLLSILWDKTGQRYNHGPGLHVLVNGHKMASSDNLEPLTFQLPPPTLPDVSSIRRVNFAVNNDGDFFPRLTASHTSPQTSLSKAHDGNYWYHLHPPNRWTTEGSSNGTDWLELDLGQPRSIDTLKLYFLDDPAKVKTTAQYTLEYWTDSSWKPLPGQKRSPEKPHGRRANAIRFPEVTLQKLRVRFTHAKAGHTGLTEIEAWGKLEGIYSPPPPPPGNLALNQEGPDFPKASASFHDIYGGIPRLANDGRMVYTPSPVNRWTSYGSPKKTDWLEIDFGQPQVIGRIEMGIYDDRGGVQPPESYTIQIWKNQAWQDVPDQVKSPSKPTGNTINSITFEPVTSSRFRVIFTHKGRARSGVTEIMAWKK